MLDFISEENIKILDICIGTGTNSIIISEKRPNAEIVGIDLSEEMLTVAKQKIDKKGIRNIQTFVMDATNIKFDANSFDVILISLVLHEIDNKIRNKIIKEARRVLKSNGKIIIVEWDKPKKLIQKLIFLSIKMFEPKGFKQFLQLNLKDYFEKFSLNVISERKCDYSRIIEITKK
jgi:demethylmenaquinone methyltransferase/2-methoxy-6-polyprenyl-1,4-benzoquinol methylase